MADEDHVRAFHVGSRESERREDGAAVEIRVQQQNLALVVELEIPKTRPPDGERLRTLREVAAGGYQHAILAARIDRLCLNTERSQKEHHRETQRTFNHHDNLFHVLRGSSRYR